MSAMKTVTVLAIESSCDETAAAVVRVAPDGRGEILANEVYSQTTEHVDYGGVVPEIAARAHVEKMDGIVAAALQKAKLTGDDLDAIAATSGPGLLGGLLVGVSYAKTLAMVYNKPFLGANHLEGHALTCRLTDHTAFPYILLLTSGGHCLFVEVRGVGDYTTLGSTLDDAAGEAFDKIAKIMGLPYPGGPHIERLAKNGDKAAFELPIGLKNPSLDFSFSGLKTAARQIIEAERAKKGALSDQFIANMAASVQHTIAKTMAFKVKKAFKATGINRLVVAGGVAANTEIRQTLEKTSHNMGAECAFPPIGLCTDNAAMIAYTGAVRFQHGQEGDMTSSCQPRWPLDNMALKQA